MAGLVPPTRNDHWFSRLGGCALAVVLGGLAAAGMLAAAARPAWAATAQTRPYPGSSPCDTTLQACLDGASPGDTIVIQPGTYITSLTLSQAVSLTGVSSATVILQALPNQRVLTVTGVTVDASVVISGLTFTGGSEMAPIGVGGGILLTFGTAPRLMHIRVIGNQASYVGGGVYAPSLHLAHSLVQSNTAGEGGGGIFTFLDAAVTGSRFEANACTLDECLGGGLYAYLATVTQTTFVTNTARKMGGGLMAATAITLSGGLFQQNACTQSGCLGGGLMTSGTLSLNGAAFISNSADFHGGGAYVVSATTATGGLFRANHCVTGCSGGGLYATGALVAAGTVFTSNTATGDGGAVWAQAPATLTGVQMRGNACTAPACNGGGLRALVTATVSGGQFISNSATGNGGALAVGQVALFLGAPLTITDALVVSNTAVGNGGGAWVMGIARLSGGQFISNAAQSHGGGLYVTAQLIVSGTQFIANRADSGGGGSSGSENTSITGALFQSNVCLAAGCNGGGLSGFGVNIWYSHFISNVAQARGGGLMSYGAGIHGSVFQGNACLGAGCDGGGAWANLGLTVIDSDFISNTAQGNGGGAYIYENFNLAGSLFQDNHAVEGAGGGAYANSSMDIAASDFLSNTAGSGGGAIRSGNVHLIGTLLQGNSCSQAGCLGGGLLTRPRFSEIGLLNAVGSQFVHNSSLGGGGGAAISGTATLSGTVFAGNACAEAGCQGGGLRVDSGLAVTATQFLGNRAAGMGGGVAHQAGDGSVVNALFARNSAGTAGAALYLAAGGAVNVVHTTIASPTLGAGAAIDVVSGTVQIIDTLVASYSVGLRRLSAGSLYEDYNLFFGVSSPKVGIMTGGANDTSGDPRFINPAVDDYHLRRGSAAIDAGADFAVTTDFDGETRPHGPGVDIGYDEAVDRVVYLPLLLR